MWAVLGLVLGAFVLGMCPARPTRAAIGSISFLHAIKKFKFPKILCTGYRHIPYTVIYCGLNEGTIGTVLVGKGREDGRVQYCTVHSDLTLQKAGASHSCPVYLLKSQYDYGQSTYLKSSVHSCPVSYYTGRREIS